MKITGNWISAKATQDVCSCLIDAGFQALFVGGCVRNALLGESISDIDIATDAEPGQVIELADQAGLKSVPTGIEHGTVTVISGEVPYEVTTFRKDVETDGRRAVVSFSKDVLDDARRRDFTMNALYARPDGAVIDPLGGLPDLHARRFRFIENASSRIQEDYLRSLRFFRFNAWYGDSSAGLDAEALAAIAQNLEGLRGLSRERVGSEILKLLSATDPVFAMAAMRTTGVLHAVLPGADDRALGPLVHLEGISQMQPSALRRLAAIGGEDVSDQLRLSNAQTKQLILLRDLIGQSMSSGELGYRYGVGVAQDAILLRSAMLETELDLNLLSVAKQGAMAKFPLKAADLQPQFEGPALGKVLKETEQLWIKSGFSLGRGALLKGLKSS